MDEMTPFLKASFPVRAENHDKFALTAGARTRRGCLLPHLSPRFLPFV